MTVASFQIAYTQYLNPQGEQLQKLPEFARDPNQLIPLYRAMVFARAFDSKAIALQRTGKLGTFASALGQEAIGVGVACAMQENDVLVPSYRDHAAQFVRGVAMVDTLLYWGGDERGSDFARARLDLPNCVPIGTQICHAAGVALAFKLKREANVAVCFFGDGATSKGDFYEGMNAAGVWTLPLVMVINNNQWAISMSRKQQTAAQTLAQKAIAAGIEGHQVDGNDIIAVRQVAQTAIDKARAGGGPTLIEALSYRLGDHTTADDATRYRDPDIVKQQWSLEPIIRLRNYLVHLQAWDKDKEERLQKECAEKVNQTVDEYLATPPPTTRMMFDQLYAKLPLALEEQLAVALHFASINGAAHG